MTEDEAICQRTHIHIPQTRQECGDGQRKGRVGAEWRQAREDGDICTSANNKNKIKSTWTIIKNKNICGLSSNLL